ncbi:uncharacterized protein HD556DRAFT_1304856 [Suillus plorans]|uniref:DUF6532 domain-containing protein n=1 Tax=Suillus plorans TaxID=116603 RepID=A0A9P7DQT3_9AGAM|nr:uncharacterized protein HD556DRAFT_1304856 [Suillus plorans]KAG1800870.1 hypothetical protein HD556DRAFT_1304856 [Suillus plorans]
MPPKASASRKHTKIMKKRPSRKNAKAIKKPGKNSGLNPSLNSDASQIGIRVEQPQPPASYQPLISLIDSEGMDEDKDEDEMEEEDDMEEADEHLAQPGPLQGYHQPFRQLGPPPDSWQLQRQHLGQPGPSHNYPPPLMQPRPLPDSRQLQRQHLGQPGPLHDYPPPLMQPRPLPDSRQLQQQHLGQPGPSHDYHSPLIQPGPPPDSWQLQRQQLEQPGPSHDYHPPLMQPGPPPDSRQLQQQPAPYAHTYGLPQIPFTPPELVSREAHHFDVPTPTTFRNIGRMHDRQREEERTRYLGHLPIDLPGIQKVFVYDPCRPPEGHRGQMFPTGVIRATGDITVTAPLPSRRELPPVSSTPPSPITTVAGPGPVANSPRSHPYAPQCSTNEKFKTMMEAAKSNMRCKVLLENAMPETGANATMAEAALSTARWDFMPDAEVPNYETCLKTLRTLTTTIRMAFKTRARHEVPVHYDLNRPLDANMEITHRKQRVPTLIENHAYLFLHETNDPDLLSPVNHPGVHAVIVAAVWETGFHTELDIDDVDALDNVISLGGAATHSVLMEHLSGRRQTVEFSVSSSSGAEYRFIQQHNLAIREVPAVYDASISSKKDLVERGISTISAMNGPYDNELARFILNLIRMQFWSTAALIQVWSYSYPALQWFVFTKSPASYRRFMVFFWDHFMLSFWNYFTVFIVTSPASEQGSLVSPETLDANSHAESPTINFDSDNATGARYNTPGARFWPQQPPSPVASGYSSQILTCRRNWERVTYLGPGSVVGSPTMNIRSPHASGTTFR